MLRIYENKPITGHMQSVDIDILISLLYLLMLSSNYLQKLSLFVMSCAKECLHFMAQKLFIDKKCVLSTRPIKLCAMCDRVLSMTRDK